MSIEDVPRLIPARMVNEYAFCPRFFHIGWVEGLDGDNALTVEGKALHRRSDRQSGAAPLPDDEAELKVARSVTLSSDALGLIARIDVLEGDGDSVVPVDIKGGSGPPDGARPWEPELVQLAVQGLLLHEAGYRCERGMLSFLGSRRRFEVEFDAALVERTLELVAEMRHAATATTAPPPLVDSPKCKTCIHNATCLPDEVNLISGRQTAITRRLLPSKTSAAPLYVTEQGVYLRKDHGRIDVVKDREKVASVRALDVSHVALFGNVSMSTPLLRSLLGDDIAVSFFSYGGWFAGIAHGMPANNVSLRRSQFKYAESGELDVARRMVRGKIRNSRTVLMRNSSERDRAVEQSLKQLADDALEAVAADQLLGVEGAAARLYFSRFATMLGRDGQIPIDFDFERRNRRPPTDRVNCLLSFAYGLLVRDLTAVTLAVGFDPMMGVFHRPRFGRPALALDLAEEFRPLVAESVVLQVVNNGEIGRGDFTVRAGGVALTASGRRSVLAAYERRMSHELKHPVFGYRVDYRRAMEVQVRLLAAYLVEEIDEYKPLLTR